jgi:hypothetical protein
MPYRALDEMSDFSAFVPTTNRRAENRAAWVAALTLLVAGTIFALHSAAPYFLVAILPGGLQALIVSCVRLRRMWRLQVAVPVPVKRAREGVVAIRGRVVVGERRAVVAPVSGALAVFVRVVATAEGPSEESRGTVADATARIDFCVDDGSGELAHVALANAKVIEPALVATMTHALSAPLEAFIRGDSAGRHAPACSVAERALRVDDEVIVLGPARRVPVADAHHPGRLMLGDGATPLVVSRVPLASPSPQIGLLGISLVLIGLALFPFILRVLY